MNTTIKEFTIERDGLHGENISDDGSALGVLAAAVEWPSYNDCFDQNFDYIAQSMNETFKQFNFEGALIDALNDAGSDAGPIFEQCGEDAQEYAATIATYAAPDQPLQLGAFMALKHPDTFRSMLATWKDAQRDAMNECTGDYIGRDGLYAPLAKELQQAYEWIDEYMLSEYLNGDRSDIGLLGTVERKMALESVDYNKKTGAITIKYDIESPELQELHGYADEVEYAESPEEKEKIKAEWNWPGVICDYIEARARSYIEKEREKRIARNEQYKAERASREEYEKRKEAERVARLEAMKK